MKNLNLYSLNLYQLKGLETCILFGYKKNQTIVFLQSEEPVKLNIFGQNNQELS